MTVRVPRKDWQRIIEKIQAIEERLAKLSKRSD